MANIKKHPVGFILLFYLACFVFRAIEYIFLRTDQSLIGEAFIHKLIGIGLLAVAVRLLHYKWSDIGFHAKRAVRGICLGLLFGGIVYIIAYSAEILMQISAGNKPSLQFFVTSYSIQGNQVMQAGALFILICVFGNIINVIMEEGVFRGLFVRLAEEKYSFIKACLLASLLFGFWHIAQPVRNVLDGAQSPVGALMMGLMLVGTSTLGGIQYVLLYKLTGALWVGMAAHFVNNAIINLLHIVTISGIDEMQTIRITIAQTLFFVVVLIIFLVKYRKKQPR
jgi:membrane protease YdiL (CAAX protease family)